MISPSLIEVNYTCISGLVGTPLTADLGIPFRSVVGGSPMSPMTG